MSALVIKKIIFGEPNAYHFVTFTSGEHETTGVEDRHDIDIEVMVSASAKIEDIEKIALEKAKRFIQELANTL